MKVLVTGGHGFIGSFLVEKLLKEGFSVRCLVRKTSDLKWIKNLSVELVVGDITQKETLGPAVQDVDYIYHVAGAIKGATSERFYSINCDGTIWLAEAAQKYAPQLKRFIFISSVAATGPVEKTLQPIEESPCHPVSDYGKSKLKAEQELKKRFPNLPLTIIRPPIVYGPRDTNFLMIFKYGKRGFFPMPAPYERYFSIVHVQDLVDGIYEASINEKGNGQTYFIANPEFYSFENMAILLSRPFSKKPKFIPIPLWLLRVIAFFGDIYSRVTKKEIMLTSRKYPEIKATSWICSPEKARRELHFQTKIPFPEGVEKTVHWLQEHHYL